ncbi:monovalent cation/H(+) antiporter subunit G [Agrobacterium rosae]|jgi:multicomponent Na+:H+ antiporter subunit G|uniref:Multiple resistance and pH homeostasis protein G n=1 Tax=Agrobacterium rosae TaxID=1972867 RepID=A0A1R3TJA9_9HYPH|nr:monovalent cation/H(+) antiporter subunit G [Agrobacterium rosae]SCX19057.1 Multiple resistance and pH homeostasis protein G [Agrobacterium rosae]
MSWSVAVFVTFLLLLGALFSLAAAIGLNRFPDLYTRLHAASKAGTVGSGLLLVAVGINSLDISILASSLAAFCFVVLTAPVSAHLLAKAAYQMGYRLSGATVIDEFEADRKLN